MTPTPLTPCDLLIEAGWVVPVEPHGVVLERHAVVVDEGAIVALLPIDQAHARYAPRERVERPGSVLLPGLVDSHVHLDEPGRTEWEGFETGTAAAAAAGVRCVLIGGRAADDGAATRQAGDAMHVADMDELVELVSGWT